MATKAKIKSNQFEYWWKWRVEIIDSGVAFRKRGGKEKPIWIVPGDSVRYLGGTRFEAQVGDEKITVRLYNHTSYTARLAKDMVAWLSGKGDCPDEESYRLEWPLRILVLFPLFGFPLLIFFGALFGFICGFSNLLNSVVAKNEGKSYTRRALTCLLLLFVESGVLIAFAINHGAMIEWVMSGSDSTPKNEDSGFFFVEKFGEICIKTHSRKSDGHIEIPSAIKGVPVTSIGEEAFEYGRFESISIPATVRKIENEGFRHCKNLKKITFEGNSVSIGSNVFFECVSLTEIRFPESAELNSSFLFYGCSKLQSVALPRTLNAVSPRMFGNCSSLKSIALPDGLSSIKEFSFYASGLESIRIPPDVLFVGDYAFAKCISLSSVEFLGDKTILLTGLFSGCKNLTKARLPSNLRKIPRGAFRDCTSLRSIALPETLEEIEDGAFWNCESIGRVVIPESMKVLRGGAFRGCRRLKELVIMNENTRVISEFEDVDPQFKITFGGKVIGDSKGVRRGEFR